jgi:hypothetical protein
LTISGEVANDFFADVAGIAAYAGGIQGDGAVKARGLGRWGRRGNGELDTINGVAVLLYNNLFHTLFLLYAHLFMHTITNLYSQIPPPDPPIFHFPLPAPPNETAIFPMKFHFHPSKIQVGIMRPHGFFFPKDNLTLTSQDKRT